MTCLVCSGRDLRPQWDGLLVRCSRCGFLTAGPIEGFDPGRIYGPEYFRGEEYLDYVSDEAFMKRNFRRRLRSVLTRHRTGRLLEIGSAYGFFLELAREHFEVVGYEINAEAARHARETLGLDVRNQDFASAPPESLGRAFDAVVLWDVIEHLERPDLTLAKIASVTEPGAALYLTTGDVGSLVARLRGRRWRMIHPPTHLHYFSRRTITMLLERSGFEVVAISAVGVARGLRQVLYSVLVLGMRQPALYQRLAAWIPPAWGFTVNTFDIMQVVARRSPRAAASGATG